MDPILIQSILPFFFSAIIVIIITVIAEKFGTKVGGIFGTLPSTIVVAFVFISLNKGVDFAAESAAVVPAELGVNLIFLFLFAILIKYSTVIAFVGSLAAWTILSSLLYVFHVTNIMISLAIYVILLLFTFISLEYWMKVPSLGKAHVHYTPQKIIFRGVLAGVIITISVLLSNVGEVISGIFSVFPAILTSTMLIFIREHSPEFAAAIGKSMVIGISSVCTYAIVIHFLYPVYGIFTGSVVAYSLSLIVTLVVFILREKIK